MNNPYSLTFGMEPKQLISRIVQQSQVIDNFTAENPSQYIYVVTGVRGSGKTVFLSDISNRLKAKDDWIVVELNPLKDMLQQLASKLSSIDKYAKIFQKAKINLSFLGFGIEISGVSPITDIEMALEKMLTSLKEHGKRVLITVDEVTNNEWVREFSLTYQILLRNNLPVFLLMTGLYENISDLQNEKNLTFLYRAPKQLMTPLNIGAIARNYLSNLKVDEETAREMAMLTNGYSYAFQLLGYLTWEREGDYKAALDPYRQYLDEYVYDKVWSELSPKDKKVLYGIATSKSPVVKDVREVLNMTTNEWNPYKKRLEKKGLIDGTTRGEVRLLLPMFDAYIIENYVI